MGLTNEDLLAISNLLDVKLDSKLKPIENRFDRIDNRFDRIENRLDKIELTLENEIKTRLNTIESCYTDTYERYKDYADKMEAAFADIEIMKKVIAEHSEKLQKINIA